MLPYHEVYQGGTSVAGTDVLQKYQIMGFPIGNDSSWAVKGCTTISRGPSDPSFIGAVQRAALNTLVRA